MTPAELERLRTWIPEIGEFLLPGVKWRQEGAERCAVGTKLGLKINTVNGAWRAHAAGPGGWEPISLIRFLKNCSKAEATEYAMAWLHSHPGTGTATGAGDEAAEIEAAELTKRIIGRRVDIAGTAGEAYFRKRGITGDLPDFVKFLPNARVGEGAVIALLSVRGRVVGAQVGPYLDPDGGKSLVAPIRRRFMLEKAPGAVFEFPAPVGSVVDMLADTLIAEGLEDALSIDLLRRAWRVIGLPGVFALRHVQVRKGERVIVCRDGDKPGSGADQGLATGIDALILAEAAVKITRTEDGEDANSVLQAGGPEALTALIATAANNPASLSRDGEIERLSRLDPLDYDKERRAATDKLTGIEGLKGVRLETLDREVGKRRSARSGTKPGDTADPDIDDIELLDEAVDLTETFDDILAELKRYIVAPELLLATVTVWCAHAHLCYHEHLRINRSVRIAVQGRSPGCGKTTLLECVGALVPRPRFSASLTASTVLRVVGELHPTLLIDEADRVLRDQNSDLLAILNAGDRRITGFVERSIPTPDGGWTVKRFPVFGPVAYAGIDELPPTQQDRSIIIQLQRALVREIPGHLEDGNSPELTLARRRLATWAANLGEEPPRPTLPDILLHQAGRVGDKWRILIGIADLAAGRWPELIRTAALEAVDAETRPSSIARLLGSIKRIFDERANDRMITRRDDRTRIATPELITKLANDPEEEWDTANRGRAVTPYWLRDNLRQLLDPPGTIQWEEPAVGGKRGKQLRGYARHQFERAWARYLPPPHQTSEGSVGSEEDIDIAQHNPQENEPASSDASAGNDSPESPPSNESEESASQPFTLKPTKSAGSSDPSDPLDGFDGGGEDMPRPNGRNTTLVANGPIRRSIKRSPRTSREQDVVNYADDNPNKSVASIAKLFDLPKATIVELLGRPE